MTLDELLQAEIPRQPVADLAYTDILRLDQLHPLISGNKAFKLSGHLAAAEHQPELALLSFGGPFSNHLHALAAAGKLLKRRTIGVVRGYADVALTPTLMDCRDWGMELVFADKQSYARRYEPDYQQQLASRYQALVIPEGGGGEAGEVGCERLARHCLGYQQVWLAAGSGTTAQGLIKALRGSNTEVVAVNVVADQGELRRRWQQQLAADNWRLLENYHLGGFAKCPAELRQLIRHYDQLQLPLDPVYTAKLVWAYRQQYQSDPALQQQQRVLLIHSGGLQGRRGYPL